VIVVPQTLAGLERFAAALAAVRPCVRVNPLVRSHCRRVLEALATASTSLVQLSGVFEQRVLLEVVTFLEADRADVTDVRTLVGVRADVVLVVRRVSEDLPAHFARPLVLGSHRAGGQRQSLHRRRVGPVRPGGLAVKRRVHVEVFLAGETSRAAAAREDGLVGRSRRSRSGLGGSERCRQSVGGDVENTERTVTGEFVQAISSSSSGAVMSLSDVSQPLIKQRR